MEYIVTRTSGWNEKPCENAFMGTCEMWQTRTCTEEEFNERFSSGEGLWRSKGTNHHINNEGFVVRKLEDQEVWKIKIDTLEDLNEFKMQEGELILSYDSSAKSLKIEIYDDYRE